jgi:hypothetical protein
MRACTFASSFQARVYGTDHRLHRRYKIVGAEQHLGGGDEVRRAANPAPRRNEHSRSEAKAVIQFCARGVLLANIRQCKFAALTAAAAAPFDYRVICLVRCNMSWSPRRRLSRKSRSMSSVTTPTWHIASMMDRVVTVGLQP